MTSIDAKARNVRELLGGKKYTIDYFQREYRWGQKQLRELINDLTGKFMSAWNRGHRRDEVARYPSYFLGSIIISGQGGTNSVIDGQQRLTSLSVLMIWILHGLNDEDDRKQIADLIFTRRFGVNAYNLDVPERVLAMEALYQNKPFNTDGAPESVRNILDRYDDIEELMPREIAEQARPSFADWLIERVYLVEIATPSDDDAYAIFETMNDRGLQLTATEMLKSHLLVNAGSDDMRKRLNGLWKQKIDRLLEFGKEADADAIGSWLRARHAQTIRERKADARAEDFERIGTECHRWVRDVGARLNLYAAEDFANFVECDFNFYTDWYIRLHEAASTWAPGRDAIYCNGLANFTLQYPLMLAPIHTNDTEEVGWQKANLVATFVDILIARRLWNGQSIDYDTMRYAMFPLMTEIRDKDLNEIATALRHRVEQSSSAFSANRRFGLWQANKKTVRRFLARITSWLDEQIGRGINLANYLVSSGAQGHDIEHIMADDIDRHTSEFANVDEFQEHRNRIGGLFLLPKAFNRAYGALPYEDTVREGGVPVLGKRSHYLTQNSLAQSLHPQAYERNPRLNRLRDERRLPFAHYDCFRKAELEERQELYTQIAEKVWSIDRLDQIARA